MESDRTVAERSAVLDKLLEISKIAVPDGLLEMKVDQYIQQFTNQNCTDGTSLSDYLSSTYGMTEEDFKSTINTQMEENLDDELVLEALANAEVDTVDEEGFAEYVASSMESGSYDTEDELYAAFDSDYEDGRTYLEHRYLLTNALSYLLDTCKITYTGEDTNEEE
jgi:FKBP-type peptidyl-prolyl cis-trans isomerase (trigger factor)